MDKEIRLRKCSRVTINVENIGKYVNVSSGVEIVGSIVDVLGLVFYDKGRKKLID